MQTFLVISDYFAETLLHTYEGVCGSRQTHFLGALCATIFKEASK